MLVGLGVALFCCPISLFGGGVAVVGECQQLVDVDIALSADLVPQISDHVPAVSHPAAAVGSTVALVRGVVPLVGAELRLVHRCLPLVDQTSRRVGQNQSVVAGAPHPRAVPPGHACRHEPQVDSPGVGITLCMASVTLPAEAASTRAARRMLGKACAEGALSDDVTDTAQLLTSELVTNAVIHGRSPVTVTTVLTTGCCGWR